MKFPFTKKEIPRRKLFIKLTRLEAYDARGKYWMQFVESFLNWNNLKDIVMGGGMVKVLMEMGVLPNLPLWQIIVYGGIIFFILGIGRKIISILIGRWDMENKNGLWQIRQQWNSKNRSRNPVGMENIRTQIEICKALKVKHYYTNIDEDIYNK